VLRFLLDEHVNPAIGDAIRTHLPEVQTAQLARWEGGVHHGSSDEILLRAAHALGWTLVTFDQRTIVPLLRLWGQTQVAHGGVIFISTFSFAPSDVGGIARVLAPLWVRLGVEDWTNRAVYVQSE
jgi:Domain of unknown function (DUF5615)